MAGNRLELATLLRHRPGRPATRTQAALRRDGRQGETTMKPSLRPGVSKVNRLVVNRERTISFMGEDARTYATPSMILDIEHTCRELILEHADAGEDSVGMEVAVKHLAPTLMDMTVEITVKVAAVEGRKITFEVAAKDGLDAISSGSHTRFVVDKAKTFERIKAKAARWAAQPGAGG
jgi:fluoroacetyl-CoA thioesterase